MNKTIVKTNMRQHIAYKIKRDANAWRGLYGIWKDKKIVNPLAWQRKIRKEWERK